MEIDVGGLIISLVTAPMPETYASFVARKSEPRKAMTDEVNSSLTSNPPVIKIVVVCRLEDHQLDVIIVESRGETRSPELSKCN